MRYLRIILVAICCLSVRADVIVLKDGTRVEGDVKRNEGGYDVTGANGKVTKVPAGSVASIQLGKSGGSGASKDRLASLKRSAESIDDLSVILARYNAFIAQKENASSVEDAKKELAIWQERADKQMVKVAGKWVTSEQHEQLVAQSGEIIKDAYELMKANKLKEAEPVLKQALAIDPQNPVANYLMGVILFRGDKLFPALKAFEITKAQLPSDAATANNMAVINWRQNKYIVSLGFYCEAMLAMPANKEILNNVAEALAALKDDLRKHQVAQRASRLFVEQEATLERVMAQYGWYRWGSMWLDQNQLSDLKKAEKEVKDKMAAMQKTFDDLVKQRRDNDAKITNERQIMQDIETSNTFVDPQTGMVYRNRNLPQSWYDAAREVDRLDAENKTIEQNLAQMRESGKRLEASKPKPKYTGQQNLIGVEGTPRIGLVTPEPASQPTTAPSTGLPADTAPGNAAPTTAPVPAPPVPATNRVF